MNLIDLLNSADFLAPGAALAPVARNNAVDTKKKLEADASPSDLASHHLWSEPSSTDVTIRRWGQKRKLEKQLHRNMDPFEADAERSIRAGRCRCKGSARR